MDSVTWQAIRGLRAAPTGSAAADPARRRTFSAALRQAEELADAAESAGYASKSLPLFYSLSQAGRAIAAAHLQAGPWKRRGHGLRVTTDVNSPLNTSINPAFTNDDLFSGVAAAIGSPSLESSALGELWAANPDLREVPIPASAGHWLRAIEIPIGAQYISSMIVASTGTDDPEYHQITTGGSVDMALDLPGQTGAEVAHVLERYPTLHPLQLGSVGPARSELARTIKLSVG